MDPNQGNTDQPTGNPKQSPEATPPSPAVITPSSAPAVIPTESPAPFIPQVPLTIPTQAPTPSVIGGASQRSRRKGLLIGSVVALVVVIGGAAVFYFGYYRNSSVIYSQSLHNTGKGYDKLVSYVDQQAQLKHQSYSGSGSYTYKSAGFSTDGTMASRGDGSNGEFTFDIGLAGSRVKGDVRAIKASGVATPDFYVRASGLAGLGALSGTPEFSAVATKLDNTWVVIDHTLLDSLAGSAGAQSAMSTPTREQLLDEARAFGKVNQEYVFTTDKDKAVTKVIKSYGAETVAGHHTYHYKAALQKDNVKKYITAQQTALTGSKLGAWLKQGKYDATVSSSFDSMKQSADKITDKDTFDIWMDLDQRIVYKIRVSDTKNPAQNYTDLGLDYTGGDKFPFFVSTKTKGGDQSGDMTLTTTLDTKSGDVNSKFDYLTSGSDSGAISATFNFKPSNAVIKIDKPSGAKPVSQVMSELGLGNTGLSGL